MAKSKSKSSQKIEKGKSVGEALTMKNAHEKLANNNISELAIREIMLQKGLGHDEAKVYIEQTKK